MCINIKKRKKWKTNAAIGNIWPKEKLTFLIILFIDLIEKNFSA